MRTAGSAASSAERTPRLAIFAALLIVFMLGMALRLHGLDTDSLGLDEVKTVNTSRLDLPSMLSFQARASVHPPLLYVVTHLLMDLCGDSDFVVRLQAALFGSVSVLLAYKLGEIFWSRQAGLIGAFLLAISAYHLRYSQEARHYSLMVFLSLLSLILLLKALEGGRWRTWVQFAICASLLIYTHYFSLLVLAAELTFAVWVIVECLLLFHREPSQASLDRAPSVDLGQKAAHPKVQPLPVDLPEPASPHPPDAGPQALRLFAAITLVGMSYLPWLPSLQQQLLGQHIQFEGLGEGTLPHVEFSIAFLTDALHDYTQVDGSPLLLFLALITLGLASSRLRYRALFGLWIVPPFVVPFVVRTSHFFSYRYAVFVVPILLLAVARGVAVSVDLLARGFPALRDHREARAILLSVLTTFVFGALAVTPITDYYSYESADLPSAARYLQQALQPGDVVLIDDLRFREDRRVRMALSHYLSALGAGDTPLLDVGLELWGGLSSVRQDQGRVWAVLCYSAAGIPWQGTQDPSIIVDFPGVLIISPPEPSSGDRLQDAASTLEVLLGLMPRQAPCFDVHLALAEIYLTTWQLDNAKSELELATAVRPHHSRASDDLRTALRDFEQTAVPAEGLRHPVRYRLGQVAALLGYEIHTPPPGSGQPLRVRLWWGALADVDRDYTVFVHLVDQDGHILAQDDKLLQRDNLPSSAWPPGSLAMEEYQLQLPPDATPGDYLIKVGVYYWETGERLPVWDEQWRRQPDDTMVASAAQ
jgi:mannosyltransferase